jgi:cobalamin biosynthesis Mg chelatase CobN
MAKGYFGDFDRNSRTFLMIMKGLERKRDKDIDEILNNTRDVDNVIESVDQILNEFEENLTMFGVEIFGDDEETVKKDLKVLSDQLYSK